MDYYMYFDNALGRSIMYMIDMWPFTSSPVAAPPPIDYVKWRRNPYNGIRTG